jgi:antitoxin component YwqK of YwqJK toxin-antitoxin module
MNPVTEFYDNGKMKSWRQTDGDTEHFTEWCPQGGLRTTWRKVNGLKDGEFKSYCQGSVSTESNYLKGEQHGCEVSHYNDKIVITEYRHGKRHGTYMECHSNGRPAVFGMFVNDLNHDEWTFFDTNGNIIKEELWCLGKLITREAK